MNKKILFLTLLVVLILPLSVFADNVTVQTIVNSAVKTTFYIASGVVVILWVITGLLFLSASGDPGKLTTARHSLMAAVAGTILVIVAASAISIVGSAFGLQNI